MEGEPRNDNILFWYNMYLFTSCIILDPDGKYI